MTSTSEEPQTEVAAPAEPAMLYGARRADTYGQTVLHPTRDQYVAVVKQALDDGYEMCVDVTAVDYLAFPGRALPAGVGAERYELVVNLLSFAARQRIRLRVQVPGDDPAVPTLFDLYPGTEAMEREIYDMFGITFTDHPDLTRILMPEDWEGHPLRKDYEVGHIPVQFSSANPGANPGTTGATP
jgi:NADH-quinone oxidoreductase subunit C